MQAKNELEAAIHNIATSFAPSAGKPAFITHKTAISHNPTDEELRKFFSDAVLKGNQKTFGVINLGDGDHPGFFYFDPKTKKITVGESGSKTAELTALSDRLAKLTNLPV